MDCWLDIVLYVSGWAGLYVPSSCGEASGKYDNPPTPCVGNPNGVLPGKMVVEVSAFT
ncbi:MAG: hypothetical protein QXJ41_14035 [Saccharolobus sp.]|uniref:hypothetical protein n=1 Tax=Saccharolobus sp. TaxID=2100761 RepID=UPI00317B86CA